jgi:hypothetical protein
MKERVSSPASGGGVSEQGELTEGAHAAPPSGRFATTFPANGGGKQWSAHGGHA